MMILPVNFFINKIFSQNPTFAEQIFGFYSAFYSSLSYFSYAFFRLTFIYTFHSQSSRRLF